MTCHGRFCDRDKLERCSYKHSVAENRNSCAFSEVLLGLGFCQSVTRRGALFLGIQNPTWILEVFACAGAVFYENLVLPCVFAMILKADRCNATAMRADTVFGVGLEPPGWFIIVVFCFRSCEDLARLPLPTAWCPSRQFGRPFWRVTFTYNFPNQFSLDKWKNIVTRVCGFVRLRSQRNLNFYFWCHCTCVEDEASGGFMSPRLITDLDVLAPWPPLSMLEWTFAFWVVEGKSVWFATLVLELESLWFQGPHDWASTVAWNAPFCLYLWRLKLHSFSSFTVGFLGSETHFQVKKSACFWCHGILRMMRSNSFCSVFFYRRMVKKGESIIFVDVFCFEHDLDAANLMDSDFAKAWRYLQFWTCQDVSFVAGTRRSQPYGFSFCESFAQFAIFGLARCIFRGRRRTQPTLWFQILRKLRQFAIFGLARCIFRGRRKTVSAFAKASHNLQLLDLEMHLVWQAQDLAKLMIIFRGRRCTIFVADAVREHKHRDMQFWPGYAFGGVKRRQTTSPGMASIMSTLLREGRQMRSQLPFPCTEIGNGNREQEGLQDCSSFGATWINCVLNMRAYLKPPWNLCNGWIRRHQSTAWLGRILKFIGIWILNPLKPVTGSQHWSLRCLGSIFGIRLIIFVFGDFCVFKERFCGNASHPVVAFVSVVAFCGLF